MGSSIPEQVIAQVFSRLPSGTTVAIGRRAVDEHGAPPRVVAVPLGASIIDPPDRHGDPGYKGVGRILLIRRFQIEWHCHGAPVQNVAEVDFAQAEALLLVTMRAVRNVAHNSVVFSDERWHDQQEGADSFERFGTKISFMSTIDLPVYSVEGQRVVLTADPQIVTTMKLNEEDA